MESSDSEDSSSDSSSILRGNCQASNIIPEGIMHPPASLPSATQKISRSHAEWALIKEADSRLNQTLELARDQLGLESYVYELSKAKQSHQFHLSRARQKHAKAGSINGTFIAGSDVASLVSARSVRSQGQFYHSYFLAPHVPNASFAPRQHVTEPYSSAAPSSRYCSGPSGVTFEPYGPIPRPESAQVREIQGHSKTLLTAIHETVDGSDVSTSSPPQRQKTKKNQQTTNQMLKVPGPSTSTSHQNPRKAITKRRESPVPDSEESDSDAPPQRSKPSVGVKKRSAKLPKAVAKLKNLVTLKNWRLTLIGEDLGVVGTDRYGSVVRSGAVIRYLHPTVYTTKGMYQVEGKSQFGERASQMIVRSCLSGFPRQWRMVTKKWLAEKQKRKSPKKTSPKKRISAGPKSSPNKKATPSSGKKMAKPQKRRSKSMELPKSNRKSLSNMESEGELQRNPVKQKGPSKRSKSEENKSKKAHQEVSSESESDESEDEDTIVERKNDKLGRKVQQDSEGSESEDSVVESSVKRAEETPVVRQDQGSDTSWCSTPAKVTTPTPKVKSKKQPQKCVDKPQVQKRGNKPTAATKEAPRTNKKIPSKSTTAKNVKNPVGQVVKELASKSKSKPIKRKSPVRERPPPSKQSDEENRRPADGLFSSPGLGDDSDYFHSGNPFGGRSEDGFSAGGRSMTPNALLESCALGNLPAGRFTPPLQSMQHLFNSGGRSKRLPSAVSSPSSSVLNSSRDNPVLKRMTKNVTEASKKRPNKKARDQNPSDVLDSNPEVADLMKAFKNTNNKVPTPAIIKKHFRHEASGSSDEEDHEESQVY